MIRRALLGGLVLLAGCGGGTDGGDPAAYRTAGDALCSDYATAIAKLGQPAKVQDIGPYIEKALPVLRRTVARVQRLDPPSDLADEYAAFRDAARSTVGRAEALRDAARAADGDEVQRLLAEAKTASAKRKELARAAKLDTCAKL
jgi:hypothetical protein